MYLLDTEIGTSVLGNLDQISSHVENECRHSFRMDEADIERYREAVLSENAETLRELYMHIGEVPEDVKWVTVDWDDISIKGHAADDDLRAYLSVLAGEFVLDAGDRETLDECLRRGEFPLVTEYFMRDIEVVRLI